MFPFAATTLCVPKSVVFSPLLFLVCRVPSRCGAAAGDERQGGQPEPGPGSGPGRCGPGQQDGAAPGEGSPLTAPDYNPAIFVKQTKKKRSVFRSGPKYNLVSG